MTNTQRRIFIFIVAALICLCAIAMPFAGAHGVAYAENKTYSNVMDDLGKDASFDAAFYPAYPDEKYSIQVITIAESEDDELFVYTYQPSAMTKLVTASSIDISTTIYEELAFHNYPLELLSRQGVFAKYLVKYLPVERKGTRYYSITDILRPWDKDIDKAASGGNTISEVPFTVAKQWKIGELNGKPYVQIVDIETIEVTDKFCGFVRYPDGFRLFKNGACDSHFVAFNTDRPIDTLLEADVYYTYQDWEQYYRSITTPLGTDWQYDDPKFGNKGEKEVTVQSEQSVDYSGGGLFAGSFTWNRIESITDFIAGVDFNQQVYSGAFLDVSLASKLTDSAKTELKGKKWVLRFLETDYEEKYASNFGTANTFRKSGTIVGDVKILRLKFVTNGHTYNLGVVDNKQSGDPDNPVNDTQYNVEPKDWLERLWEIIKIILIVTAVIAAVVLIVWLIAKVVQMTKSTKVVIKGDVLPSKSREPSRPKSKKPKKSNKQPKRKAKRRST